jgi:hypothetical protein
MNQIISIQRLDFNNFSEEVLLKTRVQKDQLSYSSTMVIQQKELNKLMNFIQHQNPSVEIMELIESDELEDMIVYKLELESLANSIDWTAFTEENQLHYKQIRA